MTPNMKSLILSMGIAFILCVQLYAQEAPFSLRMGDKAIDFSGIDQNNENITLFDELNNGPVVLMFYRGVWCGSCTKQLSELEDSINFITDKGGIVIAVTPEKPEHIKQTLRRTKASFKIIHDRDLKIMNAYNVTYRLQDAVIKKYKSAGIDLRKYNGDNGPNLPVTATYIIGQDHKILFAFFDPDHSKRATVSQILQNL